MDVQLETMLPIALSEFDCTFSLGLLVYSKS